MLDADPFLVQKDIQKDYPFILCVAVRLARYNVKEFDGAFYGIPITAAGIVMILSSLLVPYLPVIFFCGSNVAINGSHGQ
ncbi:hypothetical protein F3157_13835 [Virgibacillus dakarensis]|nr:hypothetical protein [Virgibacillus dakarensis]